MIHTYFTQRFIWDSGLSTGMEPVKEVTAGTNHAAAEQVMGERMVSAGPINRIALKVWEKARRDVKHCWSRAP